MGMTVSQILDALKAMYGVHREWTFTYQASLPDYSDLFDNTGYALKFTYPAVLYTLDGFDRKLTSQFYFDLRVYRNGLLFDPSGYTVKSGVGSDRLYINRSLLSDGDEIIVRVEKYYKTEKYFVSQAAPSTTANYSFKAPVMSVGERFDEEHEIIIARKASGGSYTKPLDPSEFTIVRSGAEWLITVNSVTAGDTFYAANMRAYGDAKYTAPLPAVSGLTGVGQILALWDSTAGNDPLPLPFKREEELTVWADGKVLVKDKHYNVIWNETSSSVPPLLAFKGNVLDGVSLDVRVDNRSFSDGTSQYLYVPKMDSSGIIDLGSFGIPIDPSFLDVSVNGRRVPQTKMGMIAEEILQISDVPTVNDLIIKLCIPLNSRVQDLMSQYSSATKSATLQDIRTQGFGVWLPGYVTNNSVPVIPDDAGVNMQDTEFFDAASESQDANLEILFLDEFVNNVNDAVLDSNADSSKLTFFDDFSADANADIEITGVTDDQPVDGNIH